jgi:hypothetical protein
MEEPKPTGTTKSHFVPGTKLYGVAELPDHHVPGGTIQRLIMVHDDDDFALVHKKGYKIHCPQEGCPTLLIAVGGQTRARHLRIRTDSPHCTHAEADLEESNGGGLETAEHFWMKYRIARVVGLVGFECILEDAKTHADVLVVRARRALEYQRGMGTDFKQRTEARASLGMGTIWFYPDINFRESPTPTVALTVPHVFIGVYPPQSFAKNAGRSFPTRATPLKPWKDRTLDSTARLYVSGNIVNKAKSNCFLPSWMGLPKFLKQVLSDERIWLPSVPVLQNSGKGIKRCGAWVLRSDWLDYQTNNWRTVLARQEAASAILPKDSRITDGTVDGVSEPDTKEFGSSCPEQRLANSKAVNTSENPFSEERVDIPVTNEAAASQEHGVSGVRRPAESNWATQLQRWWRKLWRP